MENSNQNDRSDVARILQHEEKDSFLARFIGLANSGLESGITLNVGGLVISGTLISGKKYFDTFNEQFSPAVHDLELRETIEKMFTELSDNYDGSYVNYYENPFRFIHLRDARWHYPSGNMPNAPMRLWRGKISSVDGFTIGNIV